MNAAAADVANAHPAANDWARSQTARTLVRAAMNSSAVVYRRTWPSQEAIDLIGEAEYDPKLRCNGWLDSTLDLRDGLSVVEVFARIEEPVALQEFALLRR
jgi:hypothetical protein